MLLSSIGLPKVKMAFQVLSLHKASIAFQMLSLQLEKASRLTLREVYFLNKAKRALHRLDVHKRKLRKKHEGRRKK